MKFIWMGDFIRKNYKKVLWGASILTLVLVFFMSRLELNMKMMDLLPKSDSTVESYKEALKNFNSLDSIIVGVKGEKDNIEKFIEEKAEEISEFNGVDRVNKSINEDFFMKYGYLTQDIEDIENSKKIIQADNLVEFFQGINDNFEKTYTSSGDTDKIEEDRTQLLNYLNLLRDFIPKLKNGKVNEEDTKEFMIGSRYFISPDEKLGIFMVNSSIPTDNITEIVTLVNKVESYLKESAKDYNVEVDITGTQVIMRDEMVISGRDMNITSIISIILIFVIFLLAFRLWRYSFLALVPLILGIIWSMGLTALIIGSLNMMTAMMGAILIGLGIDYSIHIISLFLEERDQGKSYNEAVKGIYEKTIKGVIAGSITTAIGFFMFIVSDFPGFREFGIVLGIGIVSTLAASVFVLPSLLMVFGRKKVKKSKFSFVFLDKLESVVIKRKYITIIIVIIIMAVLGTKIKDVKFEKDMMKIEAKGLESVKLNRTIIDKFDFSSDNAMAVSKTLDEARDIGKRADDLRTVGQVSSIKDYLPEEEKQKKRLKVISEIISEANFEYNEKPIDMMKLKDELYRLEDNIIELSDLSYMGGEEKLTKKCDSIIDSGIISGFAKDLDNYKDNLVKAQRDFFKVYKKNLRKVTTTDIIDVEDLPENIKKEYIGDNGKYLTIIYPKGDVWNSDFQKIHFKELESLDADVSGSAFIFIRVMEIAAREGKRVLIYTLIAIYLVLLMDLRNIKYATLAILPMLGTLVMTLGIMGWTGFKFDVVNIIGVPLIIGIGVDDGVHIIHRYLREKNLQKALKSTGKAITLTTLTTMAAFGSLLVAKYRGFVHFGGLLNIGVGLAYVMTIFLLITLIAILDRVKNS